MQHYYGYIYLILFPENSFSKYPDCRPFYFGQHKGSFNEKYFGSGKIIIDWFKTNGFGHPGKINPINIKNSGVDRYILCYGKTQQELDSLESFFINPNLNTFGCLNLREGGNTGTYSEETKIKMSDLTKKRWQNDEQRRIMSESIRKGWEASTNHEKQSENMKYLWNDPEFREKSLSEEVIKRRIEKRKQTLIEHPELFLDAVRTDAYRQKLSQRALILWADSDFRKRQMESRQKIEIEKPRIEKIIKWWEQPGNKEKQALRVKGKHWYNDGISEYHTKECPDGCISGRLKKKSDGKFLNPSNETSSIPITIL